MRKEIVLRSAASDKSDNQTVRMIDSRGKRPFNSKINIYSHKYANGSSQSLPEEQAINRQLYPNPQLTTPLMVVKPEMTDSYLESIKGHEHPKLYSTEQKSMKTTTSLGLRMEVEGKQKTNNEFLAEINDRISSVKAVYDNKIRIIIDENTKAVNELREILMDQQHRLAQKEQIIAKLLYARQYKSEYNRSPKITFTVQSPEKQKSAIMNQEYLLAKIRDLESILRVVTDTFASSEHNLISKLDRLENQIIKHQSIRISKCCQRFQQFASKMQSKCTELAMAISKQDHKPQFQSLQIDQKTSIKHLKAQIALLSLEVKSFASKQYKYENSEIDHLKHNIIHIISKLQYFQAADTLKQSRKSNCNYYLEDEDEFFYPPSERKVYQADDDYQHFQSSQQEIPSKENYVENGQQYYQTPLFGKISKV